ncbi:hypothetical protein ACIF8T_22140 [Streptomyces sp. NPDC085946]|uniref:hypothetical protein n=1 Tax=Streptomyces sp. NPDC085946 TaxID=3365744 RepID=UPI0037CD567B
MKSAQADGETANRGLSASMVADMATKKYTLTLPEELAAVALRQPAPVTVFASDEDGLRKLCGDHVVVRGL